jgi:hypothetical protein
VEEFQAALPGDCPPEFSALVIECCKYEPKARPESKLIVRGLKELFQVVKAREGVNAVSAATTATAAAAATTTTSAAPADQPKPSSTPPSSSLSLPEVTNKPLRSSSSSSGAPPASPRRQLGTGPYVGLTCAEHDEESARSLPAENGLFRSVFPATAMASRHGRLRWIQFQDAAPSQCEGWIKIAFGESNKPTKYFAILLHDVIYYFKNNKKGEKNLGRVLLDVGVQVSILDKGAKKSELCISNGTGETIRLVVSSMEELKAWNTVIEKKRKSHDFFSTKNQKKAVLQGVSKELNLKSCFHPSKPGGQTSLLQSEDRPSFPVRFSGSPLTLLLCVDTEGVRLLHAFVEETLLELPWAALQKWQICRNEVLQLYVITSTSKKTPLEMEFACLAWVTASRVFDALESFSRDSRVTVSPPPLKTPLSPSSADLKGKRGSFKK